MPTIREVKTELRHREWAEQIQECQSSGMTVTAWCKEKGISQHSIPENDKNSKAAKAVEIIDRAFALKREARKANVPPEKILEMRQKEVRPIIEEFYNFIGTLRPSKGSHLGAAVTYSPQLRFLFCTYYLFTYILIGNRVQSGGINPYRYYP